MPTRYGPEQQSRQWPYPTDLDGFLAALRCDPTDQHDTRMRVEMFVMTPVAKRMPTDLKSALVAAGLCTLEERRSLERRLLP